MTKVDIPMFRASAAFAARLIEGARSFGDTKYQFHRRVNWTYRYDEKFYDVEADYFQTDPDAYLAEQHSIEPHIIDVFALKLRTKQVVMVLLKVAAHWLFRIIGSATRFEVRLNGASIYRKCYVDDIELVFDPEEVGVLRAVYPFPLNAGRQFRYLIYLYKKGYLFTLTGNPYVVKDLIRFLVRRDVRSLQRLETRAQVRHAQEVVKLGIGIVQLSDEFDIGSLDFARTLSRFPVGVVNSAHGVGKYLPVHAYQEFHVITERQQEYYYAARPCQYTLRKLNDLTKSSSSNDSIAGSTVIRFVFLSQVFSSVSDIVASNEAVVLKRLSTEFAGSQHVSLFYRPHPNQHQPAVPHGFKLLMSLEEVNGHSSTVFASFYSTCQIDPAFKGLKVLIRGHLIYPEIVFDETEKIYNADQLISFIKKQKN